MHSTNNCKQLGYRSGAVAIDYHKHAGAIVRTLTHPAVAVCSSALDPSTACAATKTTGRLRTY